MEEDKITTPEEEVAAENADAEPKAEESADVAPMADESEVEEKGDDEAVAA
jgi:hypothetical protein